MSVDTLKNSLKKVLEEAVKSIKNVNTLSDLESMRVKYLGKKSLLNDLMKTLSDLSVNEKAQAGKDLNDTKKLTTDDVINHVLQLAPVFPVSPTASVMKSKYIEEAIIFGQANNICTKKLMGNDLIMNLLCFLDL